MANLPKLLSHKEVHDRLQIIFPEGSPQRAFCTRKLSASTVFTMLYIGAVEGNNVFLSPKHVYRMTEKQSKRVDNLSRKEYAEEVLIPGHTTRGKRWYADNTRESIRDETLREGFLQVGAVYKTPGVATTSGKGRYALANDFATLFDPELVGDDLKSQIEAWQKTHLSKGALARIALVNTAAVSIANGVLVKFPNGETRKLSPGLSSDISKAVIEHFAVNFLSTPGVLWLSESGNKMVSRDDELARKIGIKIDIGQDLPDIILVDLTADSFLLVFVEVVATDGAITDRRKAAIYQIAEQGGFDRSQVVFVTAYQDRNHRAYKKTSNSVAWNTLIWFASEPNNIFILKEGQVKIATINELILKR